MSSSDQRPDLPPLPPLQPPPPPFVPPAPLDYRPPGREPRSQWITDDDPRHGWFMTLLILSWPFAAVCGFLGSLLWMARFLVGC